MKNITILLLVSLMLVSEISATISFWKRNSIEATAERIALLEHLYGDTFARNVEQKLKAYIKREKELLEKAIYISDQLLKKYNMADIKADQENLQDLSLWIAHPVQTAMCLCRVARYRVETEDNTQLRQALQSMDINFWQRLQQERYHYLNPGISVGHPENVYGISPY